MYTTEASKVTELEAATTGVKKKKELGRGDWETEFPHPSLQPSKSLDYHKSIKNSAIMEMFPIYSAQNSRHQSHVAIESLQSDYGKWGPDRFLLLFHVINLNLNGNMQPMATAL